MSPIVRAEMIADQSAVREVNRLAFGGEAEARLVDVLLVIVLGHPEFYPRFGFSTKTTERLKSPYSGEAFMTLE